jgi:arginyl-tRNA synthetase
MIPALLRPYCVEAAALVDPAADPEMVVATNNAAHGDYQWNFAFRVAKTLKTNPRALAERLLPVFAGKPGILRAEVAGAGFINLHLDSAWVAAQLTRMVSAPTMGITQAGAGKTVVVDFSSPNVAKRMHVGHMRSTHIGHVLVAMHRAAGYTVVGDNHLGDWGTQFGKLIVAWQRWRDESAYAVDPVAELERIYVLFGVHAENQPELEDLARAETAKLQRGDPENRALWADFVAKSLTEYDAVYRRMGVAFDEVLGESAYRDDTDTVVSELLAAGVAEESEGAVIVRVGEQVSVIKKRDGAATYTTTDLACIRYRVRRWNPDRMVYVTDVRQQQHFANLFAVAKHWQVPADLIHVGFGMLKLPEGTMSTRSGNVIRLVDLLDEAVARARAVVDEKSSSLAEDERAMVAEAVGTGCIRYQDLVQSPSTDVTFDWKRMLAMDGNSAPYLLYSHARACSILRKAAAEGSLPGVGDVRLDHPHERELAISLLRYPEAIAQALHKSAPNTLAEHTYRMAELFNRFYYELSVLGGGEYRDSRLILVESSRRVMAHALGLLGLRPLERM